MFKNTAASSDPWPSESRSEALLAFADGRRYSLLKCDIKRRLCLKGTSAIVGVHRGHASAVSRAGVLAEYIVSPGNIKRVKG